jgi:hypothetical protein
MCESHPQDDCPLTLSSPIIEVILSSIWSAFPACLTERIGSETIDEEKP